MDISHVCPQTSKFDYEILQYIRDTLLDKFVSALSEATAGSICLSRPYYAAPFEDAKFNPLFDPSQYFRRRPRYLRISPHDADTVGLPIGDLGEVFTADLLRSYVSLVRGLDDFRHSLPAETKELARKTPGFEESLRRSTFWGSRTDQSIDSLAKSVDNTFLDGLFTTVQAICFLTSHGDPSGLDSKQALVHEIAGSGIVNTLAGIMPFGVIGPAMRAGMLPLNPVLARSADGQIALGEETRSWLLDLRNIWRSQALSVRQSQFGRSTAGMPCIAFEPMRKSGSSKSAKTDTSAIDKIAQAISRHFEYYHSASRSNSPELLSLS